LKSTFSFTCSLFADNSWSLSGEPFIHVANKKMIKAITEIVMIERRYIAMPFMKFLAYYESEKRAANIFLQPSFY
jgi:hypothetical protein